MNSGYSGYSGGELQLWSWFHEQSEQRKWWTKFSQRQREKNDKEIRKEDETNLAKDNEENREEEEINSENENKNKDDQK